MDYYKDVSGLSEEAKDTVGLMMCEALTERNGLSFYTFLSFAKFSLQFRVENDSLLSSNTRLSNYEARNQLRFHLCLLFFFENITRLGNYEGRKVHFTSTIIRLMTMQGFNCCKIYEQ